MTSDIPPDTKDWTWTLTRPCEDCGFIAGEVPAVEISPLVLELTEPWAEVLARPDARIRPDETTWSPLEYACHVRDVCTLFADRLDLMLTEHDPQFSNWDQDATAVESGYSGQSPTVVAAELEAAARRLSETYAGVHDEQWTRSGRRSDGSEFTVHTLGQYCLHDLAHHLWDVDA